MLSRDFLDERLVPELEQDTVQYFDHFRRYLFAQQFVQGRVVADIACGTGYGSDILFRAGAKTVFGLDINPNALNYARSRWNNVQFVHAEAGRLPIRDVSVDTLVSFETLEHVSDRTSFFTEVRRVLRSGGYFILSTPNRKIASPGSDTPFSPYHMFEPSREELITMLTDAGWKLEWLHGLQHSQRVQQLLPTPAGAFHRQPQILAWSAYIRLWTRNLLPPLFYRWLANFRHIPQFDITDSVLVQEATDSSSYFVAVCQRP